LALLPQVANRKQAFNIQLHAIDGDVNLTGEQKSAQLKELLQKFPEEKFLLDILIAARANEESKN
jgi:lipase chaperone LimK